MMGPHSTLARRRRPLLEAKGKAAAFHGYLNSRDKLQRLARLAELRRSGEHMPISLSEDLLALELGMDEKVAILEATSSREGRAFEHFLTDRLFDWPQELASLAIRLWSARTDRLLWFRVLLACRSPLLSQRVLYTVVDHTIHTGGSRVLDTCASMDGLAEMSPALHGLILHRATQWGVSHDALTALAIDAVSGVGRHLHPENKSIPSAMAYLSRFSPETVQALVHTEAVSEPWRDIARLAVQGRENADKQIEKLTKLLAKPPKTKVRQKLEQAWPSLWLRENLDAATVRGALRIMLGPEKSAELPEGAPIPQVIVSSPWEFFAGIPAATLQAAVCGLEDAFELAHAVTHLGALLPLPAEETLLTSTKQHLAAAADPAAVLTRLPLRLRLEMTEGQTATGISGKPTVFAQLKAEEAAILAGQTPGTRPAFTDYYDIQGTTRVYRDGPEDKVTLANRKPFFDAAYRSTLGTQPADQQGFWGLLADAWQKPAEAKLGAVAQASRQVEGVFRLCYLNTLGRFKGHDQAALKLLDFIRSKEEDDLRAVTYALGGIGTPRAMQELVSALTRPNVTPALQLEICATLQKHDVTSLQNELRSAIKDLAIGPNVEGASWDVREAMASLLHPANAADASLASGSGGVRGQSGDIISDAQLDTVLTGKIPHFRELSSEVKRALRTSQFFHFQVSGNNAPETIDLSPVIDMQYKALELLFRESFEESVSRVIHRGILQRRLDVIGYARPIPRQMDEFEHYIATLPIIKDIPFFSKFKLQKMLRAICQFRPGKRFTLDGLKAFALFFLCFSRNECRYGLNLLFPIGLKDDSALFEFCKALHILQDFRNRAAHEGFHPDASNDIDGIWRATAEIVQTMFKAKQFVDEGQGYDHAPRNDSSNVVIKKKVS